MASGFLWSNSGFCLLQSGDEKVNLNALGDSHVSFSARQLAVSPDFKYLLVSTDTSRIALLRIQGRAPLLILQTAWAYSVSQSTFVSNSVAVDWSVIVAAKIQMQS